MIKYIKKIVFAIGKQIANISRGFSEDHPKKVLAFEVLIVGIPAAAIGIINSNVDLPTQKSLKLFTQFHPYWYFSLFLIPSLYQLIAGIINLMIKKWFIIGETKVLTNTIELHDRFFRDKSNPLTICSLGQCGRRSGGGISAKHLISCAIQPKEALANLIKEIKYSLNELLEDESIKIVLAVRDEKGGAISYLQFYPRGVGWTPHSEMLKNPHLTFFGHVAKEKKILIIENIEEELKLKSPRYVKSPVPTHNIGSIIGMPITNPGEDKVTLILTIKSDNPYVISEAKQEVLKAIMDRFALWILYEYHLTLIEELV
ncbi:GAF domain-containing protein [Geothrix mesophila]|uniref:GAF domain-containing protein n=1 Tax=Geothrix mesophila TaxID=2922723 RepID=UPI001FACC519|nr:GAF domain-containing protein [Geothrix sp. SG198]